MTPYCSSSAVVMTLKAQRERRRRRSQRPDLTHDIASQHRHQHRVIASHGTTLSTLAAGGQSHYIAREVSPYAVIYLAVSNMRRNGRRFSALVLVKKVPTTASKASMIQPQSCRLEQTFPNQTPRSSVRKLETASRGRSHNPS
ncbi:hypothetical protein ABW21_db0204941 [Orbilia brochopaga]|nr:hypothetical protein ABW21_db0204941 [Drechslerella brochopaga]